jgi:hypothetical protein
MRPRAMIDDHESPVDIWKREKRERRNVPKKIGSCSEERRGKGVRDYFHHNPT